MRRWTSIAVLVAFVVIAFGSGDEEGTSGPSAATSPACEECQERCKVTNAITDKQSDELNFAELVAVEYEIIRACEEQCASICK